ncbi:cytochrome c [Azospirillum sp. RWY-5-1]|uniref:Cytochrome c n=1 Tax=Azospirillum oleiclasticum TaxID=2735135 RepID=A0ABX2TGB4_9PROT|nr:cytochrome c [Azospirillum oleiclasticum]NYZ14841.1 cytochrome c [Azospirillum oleiclasticum]NYZ22173.1 cytochrome c [Azospirillum oleiclasticum]
MTLKVAVGSALGAAVVVATVVMSAGSGAGADPNDAAQVARGKAVYAERCASCHGAQLEGQPDWRSRKPDGRLPAPPHDASGHTWHHPDADLFRITKQGIAAFAPAGYESDMPAFGDVLSDAEIRAVLAFIKSTWAEETRRRHAAMSGRAGK